MVNAAVFGKARIAAAMQSWDQSNIGLGGAMVIERRIVVPNRIDVLSMGFNSF